MSRAQLYSLGYNSVSAHTVCSEKKFEKATVQQTAARHRVAGEHSEAFSSLITYISLSMWWRPKTELQEGNLEVLDSSGD